MSEDLEIEDEYQDSHSRKMYHDVVSKSQMSCLRVYGRDTEMDSDSFVIRRPLGVSDGEYHILQIAYVDVSLPYLT